MDSTLTSDTYGAVQTIINTYTQGGIKLENWRKTKKQRKGGQSELKESLEAGGDELRKDYQRLRQEHGRGFEQGDEISRSTLFRIANEIQRGIVDVLARAELGQGYGASLNPSDLWHISEKSRKSAVSCLNALVLRLGRKRALEASERENRENVPRLRTAVSSMSMRPASSANFSTSNMPDRTRSVVDRPRERFNPAPARYSMASFPTYNSPLYTQPEYNENPQPTRNLPLLETSFEGEHQVPSPEEPIYTPTGYEENYRSTWALPSVQETSFHQEFQMHSPAEPHYIQSGCDKSPQPTRSLPPLPQESQMLSPTTREPLPNSLRIGHPSGRSMTPARWPQQTSIYSSGTGFLSRVATATPLSSHQEILRPHSTAPPPTSMTRDRSRSDFGYAQRGPPEARRATVGYNSKPEFSNPDFASPLWYPQAPEREQSWTAREDMCSPASSYQNFLDVSPDGHFRMPTPVNHGGHDFQF